MTKFKPDPEYRNITYRTCGVFQCTRIATTDIDVQYPDGKVSAQPVCWQHKKILSHERIDKPGEE
jgi:hypothetical protein